MPSLSPTPPFALFSEQRAASSSPSSTQSQALPQLVDGTSIPASANAVERHPKGKRKRTAAKDKIVLEDAYKDNPKPDKQARLEIVDRVSLNEKEVQIWFQNRRQNDRRKSRPLSPEELAALRYSGLHNISSDSVPSRGLVSDADGICPMPSSASSRTLDQASVSPSVVKTSPELSRSLSDVGTPRIGSQDSNAQSQTETTPPQSQESSTSRPTQEGPDAMAHSFSASVGYLANRWNLGSSFSTPATLKCGSEESPNLDPPPPSSCPSDSRSTRNPKSRLRLSLSLEGKAELVSNQPSPTRAMPRRPSSTLPSLPQVRRGLQRSHSALPTITLPPISALTNSLPPRLSRGRSRNVHAWESCADSERRDELTAQAENESNGSAIAAISLLRSSSGILQPSAAKRNASLTRSSRPRQTKKAKLSRASSTFARLENVGVNAEKARGGLGDGVKVARLVSPTDSDKENWSPDSGEHPHDRSRLPALPSEPLPKSESHRLGRMLGERKDSRFMANRANTTPSKPFGRKDGVVQIFEDSSQPPSRSRADEVERFMRGEISPSKKGDMDCVAGLLSLSQGAWR
ncbi:hypothetical protein RJ55_00358 [Drechmeria coniospora]|nr:hypothetical protein RJ55_00358 [Drechmeria coniospora]